MSERRTWQPDFLKQQISLFLNAYPELADDDELKVDTLEGQTNVIDAIKSFVRSIEDTKSLAEGTEIRIKELQERKARLYRRVDALRGVIHLLLEAMDLKHKLDLPTATLYLQKGQPKLIGDFDLRNHPDLAEEYIRTMREIDKPMIVAALKSGKEVPNFHLSNPGTVLFMKVK